MLKCWCITWHVGFKWLINPLKTKRRLLYLKTQSVPLCKHFPSRLYKPISLCCKWHKSLFVLKTHKYSVGRTYSCWILNWWCITWPVVFKMFNGDDSTRITKMLLSVTVPSKRSKIYAHFDWCCIMLPGRLISVFLFGLTALQWAGAGASSFTKFVYHTQTHLCR